jgi:hypothetical protein
MRERPSINSFPQSQGANVLTFRASNFGFVSDFEIRISDFSRRGWAAAGAV